MISVVIPAHNASSTIAQCVQALQKQTVAPSAYEIIVVDDGSADETARLATEAGAKVIYHEKKRGAAAARNSGIEIARGGIVCFTDADCQPKSDWIEQIIRPFDDPDIVGCKGVYATRQQDVAARFVQIEYEDKYDLLRLQPRIDFIDTYSAAYRRSVLVANGGFDEHIFFVEDQELSFRLAARGYQMIFQPTAVVYHLHSNSVSAYFRKKFMIGYWKAQVVRRFPDRAIKDSHTPQVLKLQLLLVASALAATAASFLFPWLALVVAGVLLAFLASTVPFVRKAWPKDHIVTLASPFLLLIRALALGMGYAWGTVKPQPGISGEKDTIGGLNYVGKRAIDIAGALVGLLFTAVAGPFIAISIKLNSPGPVIFKQERIGQGGKPFVVYKFRSMYKGAEGELDKLLDLDALEEPAFKLKNDPRLTGVGKVLRRWSLDELPQFWNVLQGDMSLIGPRPEESRIVEKYTDWHRRRLAIKPGMTGPMQVNGRANLPIDARVRLELDYIENYSLWRDIVILAKTIPAVVKGTGAR